MTEQHNGELPEVDWGQATVSPGPRGQMTVNAPLVGATPAFFDSARTLLEPGGKVAVTDAQGNRHGADQQRTTLNFIEEPPSVITYMRPNQEEAIRVAVKSYIADLCARETRLAAQRKQQHEAHQQERERAEREAEAMQRRLRGEVG
jgi:hypothetical protein